MIAVTLRLRFAVRVNEANPGGNGIESKRIIINRPLQINFLFPWSMHGHAVGGEFYNSREYRIFECTLS